EGRRHGPGAVAGAAAGPAGIGDRLRPDRRRPRRPARGHHRTAAPRAPQRAAALPGRRRAGHRGRVRRGACPVPRGRGPGSEARRRDPGTLPGAVPGAPGLKRSPGLLLLAALVAASCAKPAPQPLRDADDSLFPPARPGERRPAEAQELEKSWRALLSGDLPDAEKGFRRVLEKRSGLVPAETGLAYARLRAGRAAEAGTGF